MATCSPSHSFHSILKKILIFTVLAIQCSLDCRPEIGCQPILKQCFNLTFDFCVHTLRFFVETVSKGKIRRKIVGCDGTFILMLRNAIYVDLK